MFLTLKNEKTLKKMRSKTLENNIFFILGRNLIIRSFEIPHSIWKLYKDFKSVFVFEFRQKTKKFTPKWQKTLFEKRVTNHIKNIHNEVSSKRNNNLRATRVEIRPRCDELAKVVRPKDGRVSEDSSVKLRMEICF